MTDAEILSLAKSCGFENWTRDKGECWECLEDQLLKFAKQIYRKGKSDGYENGFEDGYFEATGGN